MKVALGDTVIYTGRRGETVVAIVTEVLPDDRVNLALIKNGVKQAGLSDYAYDVPYSPIPPVGGTQNDTWRTRSL